jgi:uncharacterized protein YggE
MINLSTWQKFWAGLALAIFIYYAQGLFRTAIFPNSPLTVVGVGQITVKPEKISFIVTHVARSLDPITAIDEGDVAIKVLIDKAKAIAGEDAEIKTSFYQILPSSSGSVTTYQVANAFSLSTNKISKASDLIHELYRFGASTISDVTFTGTDKDKTEQDARKAAVKDAGKQARAIAKAAGKRVGKIISITDDNAGATSTIGKSSDTKAVNYSLLGEIEVTKRVSLVYEIW